jgi:predicted aspartyl protease
MATELLRVIPEGRQVGQVYTTITVANNDDRALARRGLLPQTDVRSTEFTRVLVDTGATTLCLPANITSSLGLEVKREVVVETATGSSATRVYDDVWIECEGRSGVFECLELPEGAPVLLGVVPLEAMGLQPDVKNHRLVVLPESGPGTYWMAL